MAKGKQQKQQKTASSASSAREGETHETQAAQGDAASARNEAPETSERAEPVATGPYDREPESAGGALVFLGIIAVLLAGAIAVGLLQAS